MKDIARLNIEGTGDNKKMDYQDIAVVNGSKEILLSTLNIPPYYKDFVVDIDKKICDFFKKKGIVLTTIPVNKICIYPFYGSSGVGMYAGDINAVLLPIAFADQIKIIIHELIHYHSSDFANNALEEKRIAKTGFFSEYKDKKESFDQFNEGFTDFITNLFLDTLLDKQNNITDKELLDKILLIQEDMKKFYSIVKGKNIGKFVDKMFLKKKFLKSFFDKNLLTFAFSDRVHSTQAFDYNYQNLDIGYPKQVQLVKEIINGITIAKKDNTIIDHLMKGYFTGNVHVLKIVDSLYGPGFLRTISSLPNSSDLRNRNYKEDEAKLDSLIQHVQNINEGL